MPKLSPPPRKVPKLFDANHLRQLVNSVYQIFDAIGGVGGVPKIFSSETAPATYDADNPDGFFKVIAEDGSVKAIPYWNT